MVIVSDYKYGSPGFDFVNISEGNGLGHGLPSLVRSFE